MTTTRQMCYRLVYPSWIFFVPSMPAGMFITLNAQNSRGLHVDPVFIRFGIEGKRQQSIEVTRKALTFEAFSTKLKYFIGPAYPSKQVGQHLLNEYSKMLSPGKEAIWSAVYSIKAERWVADFENRMMFDYVNTYPDSEKVHVSFQE